MQNKGHKYIDSGIPTLPWKRLSINIWQWYWRKFGTILKIKLCTRGLLKCLAAHHRDRIDFSSLTWQPRRKTKSHFLILTYCRVEEVKATTWKGKEKTNKQANKKPKPIFLPVFPFFEPLPSQQPWKSRHLGSEKLWLGESSSFKRAR